jgi:alanine racemase
LRLFFNNNKLQYTVSEIAAIIAAKPLQIINEAVVEYLLPDSRKLLFPSTTLFFALPGPRRSGASYIEDLYRKGVRSFVVDVDFNETSIADYPDASFLQTSNVMAALQQLTAHHRQRFEYPLIGITGSNGKTIIKEWLYQLLAGNYNIVRSPKSYNSQVGVPLSIWGMDKTHTLGIFEAGISRRNEMTLLEKIIQPDIGVLGFIGEAHAEGFTDKAEKINEKLKLFIRSHTLIYCADDSVVEECVKAFAAKENADIKLFSWSRNSTTDLQITDVQHSEDHTEVFCSFKEAVFSFLIPFADEASVFNAVTCCAVLICMDVKPAAIPALMKELKPVEMRLEMKQGINQCAIINDSYSADINSLDIALNFLQQQQQQQRKTVILSDFLQSGLPEDILYKKIAEALQQKNLHRFIGIGPEISAHADAFENLQEKSFFSSTEEFLKHISAFHFNNEIILLKGARIFKFEKINRALEQKIHETILEINLNAVRENLNIYRHHMHRQVKLMAMVKAFSYGSGSYEIASLLQHEGIDYLAVAYTDEGVELRQAGIRLPIMVMNTTPAGFDNLIQYNLEPEIYSFNILDAFKNYLLHHQIEQYPVHIKLDTGMHRLGFSPADIEKLCTDLTEGLPFKIKSVFSHMVGSENPAHDAFSKQQGQLFIQMAGTIENAIGYPFIKHIANTSAIHRHPELQMDMVRLGIGLYGVDEWLTLENVTTLKTTISQIKHIGKGETVGYSRRGVVDKDSDIATVRIGYADGYSRIFGNGNGKMLVNGKLAPVIGSVCMDMTMLDITGILAEEGDEVIVFGEDLSVKTLAAWAQTIPYEILTNVSQRVKRVYYEE